VSEVLAAFIVGLASKELGAAMPQLESKLPGLLRALLKDALNSSMVQAKLQAWEQQGVSALSGFIIKEWDELKALILGHVHGALGAAVVQGLSASGQGVATLTAQWVKDIQVLEATHGPQAVEEAIAAQYAKLGLPRP
jgi:hypothetical protein